MKETNNSELTIFEGLLLILKYISIFILGTIFFAGFLEIVKGYDKDLVGKNEEDIINLFVVAWQIFVIVSACLKAIEMKGNKNK